MTPPYAPVYKAATCYERFEPWLAFYNHNNKLVSNALVNAAKDKSL
jgi:hypothetical protein